GRGPRQNRPAGHSEKREREERVAVTENCIRRICFRPLSRYFFKPNGGGRLYQARGSRLASAAGWRAQNGLNWHAAVRRGDDCGGDATMKLQWLWRGMQVPGHILLRYSPPSMPPGSLRLAFMRRWLPHCGVELQPHTEGQFDRV
ncbi:unnamed protein product, partial [Phaeothamnion confervicola]